MPDPRIHQASKLLAEARRINDDEHKTADDARRAHQLVRDANALRRAVELDAEIKSGEDWLSQPDYKHDMVGAGLGGSLGVPGGGFDRETKSQGFGGGGEFAPADQALATKQFFEWIK